MQLNRGTVLCNIKGVGNAFEYLEDAAPSTTVPGVNTKRANGGCILIQETGVHYVQIIAKNQIKIDLLQVFGIVGMDSHHSGYCNGGTYRVDFGNGMPVIKMYIYGADYISW